jgi:hypothetical protein
MNTATHSVEVPFPRAFASPRRSPFPSAPRYGTLWLTRETSDREVGMTPLPDIAGILRPSLSLVLWLLRSCFYLQERFTVEPANMIQLSKYYGTILSQGTKSGNERMFLCIFIHPRHKWTGLSKKDSVTGSHQDRRGESQ